jgi:carboxyl-terminal processing protease
MKNMFFCSLNILLACTFILQGPIEETRSVQDFDTTVYNVTGILAQVLQLIKQKHYMVNDLEDSMYDAIDTLLSHLDPHSGFLPPKSFKNIQTTMSGEFCGIGVVIDITRQTKDRFLTVIDTIPSGPAEKAGIKALDKIVEIDGQILEGMSNEEATAKLKGKQGTTVTVKIMRDGKSAENGKSAEKGDLLTFDIKRDVIKEQNSRSFLINDQNICYIGFNMFTENSVIQLEKLLQEAHTKKYKGIILDLRNNSGGLLQAAIDIAGLFLDKDSLVVVTKDKDNKELEHYATRRKPIMTSVPFIVILINNYTASAAEILAGALKVHSGNTKKTDHPVVILVGTKTFGKGSVQEIVPIGNNCAAKITTSLYYLPDGKSIQGIGIEPDISVERMNPLPEQVAWFNANYGREQALANYIKQHGKEPEEPVKKEPLKNDLKGFNERIKEMLENDNQFLEAVTIINFLNTTKSIAPKMVSTRTSAVDFLKKNYSNNNKISLTEIKI